MSGGVTFLVCSFNGSKRLPETMRHLAAQQVPNDTPWEVLVLDNASTDNTSETALSLQPHFPPDTLRVISVPESGKSNALVRGIREARYGVISIIDDDNWVAPDWVERVNGIFTQHPEIDYCGGRSEAVYEIPAPAWLEPIKGFYAIGSQFLASGEVTNVPGALIWGAGSTMRTSAVRKLLDDGFSFRLISRKGDRLTSSGDTELCFAMRESGARFWYDDDLLLQHYIPKQRLEWSYPLRLMRAMGESSVFLDLYLTALNRPPFHDRPAWKRGWFFAISRATRILLALVFFHPLDCYLQPEGSQPTLQFKRACGRWAMLWSLRAQYDKLSDEIRNSPWVRARPGGSSQNPRR
jgi:glycosyltransferase involved in cell wall biosynthesis